MDLSFLRTINIASIIVRITLSIVIGGLLGLERGRKHHPAGFRTYMLVCLGSTLVMMTNQYVTQYFGSGDPVRMGAQVVSGIGFLGAGTIMVTGKQQIKGITTAAGLWTAACCGLAIGIGFYEAAIIGGVTIFLIMAVFTRLDAHIHRLGRNMELYIEFDANNRFSEFIDFARSLEIDVFDIQIQKSKAKLNDGYINTVILTARCLESGHEKTLELLSNAPGIHYIEELH